MEKSRSYLRQEAYKYILEGLSKFPADLTGADTSLRIPLSELKLLKDGVADPSNTLVTSLKQLFDGKVTEAEIDAYLVEPFE